MKAINAIQTALRTGFERPKSFSFFYAFDPLKAWYSAGCNGKTNTCKLSTTQRDKFDFLCLRFASFAIIAVIHFHFLFALIRKDGRKLSFASHNWS